MKSRITWIGVTVALAGIGVAVGCASDPSGPGPAAKLGFSPSVTSQAARTNFTAPVKVEIQDASGDLVTTATNSVTLALGTNPGTILWHASGNGDDYLESVDPGSPAVVSSASVAFIQEITALTYNSATGLLVGSDRDDNLFTMVPGNPAQTLIGFTSLDYPTGLAFELGVAPRLLAVAFTGNLYSINLATGAGTSLGAMTLAGETIISGTGLATDPTTGTIYGVLKLATSVGQGRTLVTINPTTLVATAIGVLGQDGMADLAFSVGGTLYGVTGDGGTTPETLWTINKTTAATTLVIALGNGDDGEAIAAVPATLSGTLTVAAVAGVATFPGLQINAAATNYTLTATAAGLTAGTSNAFPVTP